jgi:hypothetical protein
MARQRLGRRQLNPLGCLPRLVCSVNYTSEEGDRRSIRKLFRFKVQQPLEIKTKCRTVKVMALNRPGPDGTTTTRRSLTARGNPQDAILLEVQIENVMSCPATIQSVKLEPSAPFESEDCNQVPLPMDRTLPNLPQDSDG